MSPQIWSLFGIVGLVALLNSVSEGSTTPAGVRFTMTHKGILKAINLAKTWAKADIAIYPLSKQHDFQGKVDAPFLPGSPPITINVSRIIIDSVCFGQPDVIFSPDTDSVRVHVEKGSARAFAMWNYEADVFGFEMSDNGTLLASFDEGQFDIRLKIDVEYGQPYATTSGCETNINNVKVKLTGSESWVYDTFSNVIASTVKKEFETQLCKSVEKIAQQHKDKIVDNFSGAFIKAVSLGNGNIFFNYSLMERPKITESYVDVFFDGSFVAKIDTDARLSSALTEYPQIPEDFNIPGGEQRMLYAWISDESINSYLQALINAGHLSNIVPFVKEEDNQLLKCQNRNFRINSDKLPGQLQRNGALMTATSFHMTNHGYDTSLTAEFELHLWADTSNSVTFKIDMTGTLKSSQGEHYQVYFQAGHYKMSAVNGEHQHEIEPLLLDHDDGTLLPCLNGILQKKLFIPGMTLSPFAVSQNEVLIRKGHLLIKGDFELAENYYERNFHPH